MEFLVFAQTPEPRVPLVTLLQNAQRYFGASVEVLSETRLEPNLPQSSSRVLVEVESSKLGGETRFELTARYATAADLAAAREAEAIGRAGGMAALAERCPCVWEVTPAANARGPAKYEFCAILASTALGPVMPRDASALFGVRGALERSSRAG
jgi:hypothetical protein